LTHSPGNTLHLVMHLEVLARQANLMPRLAQARHSRRICFMQTTRTLAGLGGLGWQSLGIEAEPIDRRFADIDKLIQNARPSS